MKAWGALAACKHQSPRAGPWSFVITLHCFAKNFCFFRSAFLSSLEAECSFPEVGRFFHTLLWLYSQQGTPDKVRKGANSFQKDGFKSHQIQQHQTPLWMKTVDPSRLCIFSCVARQTGSDGRCAGAGVPARGRVSLHALKLLHSALPPGLIFVGFESWTTVRFPWGFPWCWAATCSNTPHPQTPNCTLWLLDVVHSRPVSTSRCALMYAKQPVELIIMNAACPLNKWEEAPWHNKITRERARNRTQMRFHSHKLPLYYTWSIFTIGNSK